MGLLLGTAMKTCEKYVSTMNLLGVQSRFADKLLRI